MIYKKIDYFMLDQAEKLKSTPFYSKVLEYTGQIKEELLPTAKYIGAATFFAIPLLIIFSLNSYLSSTKNEMLQMEQLLEDIHQLTANNRWLASNRNQYINIRVFDSEDQYKQELQTIFSTSGADINSLVFEDFFNDTSIGASIEKAEIVVRVKNLSTEILVNLQSQLFQKKMRIERMNLNRDMNSKLIDGEFVISHYGKYVSTLE